MNLIAEMLENSNEYVGFAGPNLTREHASKVMQVLTRRGILKKGEPIEDRNNKTIKSLVKGWARNNLKMKDEDWASINIESIRQAAGEKSDIVFIKCMTTDDAALITARAKHLPSDPSGNGPRLVPYHRQTC